MPVQTSRILLALACLGFTMPAQAQRYVGGYEQARAIPSGVLPMKGDAAIFATGDIVMGYRDGYWDTNSSWHRWRDLRQARNYRRQAGNAYRDWNHDRDADAR